MTQPNLLPLISGYWKSMAIYAAAHLGLADLVKDGPRSSEDLAAATGMHATSLYRLLRALASDGIFAEQADGRFALTSLAACLLTDAPNSQRSMAITNGEEHYRTYGEILYSIQTGKPAWDKVFGKPVFDYLADHPRAAKLFDETMTGVHGPETAVMLDAYDFSGIETLVDVGGGNGSMLLAVLQKYPALQGILYDRDHVVQRAAANMKESRCRAIAGDFFERVPPGGDAYIMRHIIHDWYDPQALTILRNCRQVMPAQGRLLLVEKVVPPANEPSWIKYLDLTMMLIPGGMERTEEQYRTLLSQAGFRLKRVVATPAPIDVLEAEPV